MRRSVSLLVAAVCSLFALAGVAQAQTHQAKPVHHKATQSSRVSKKKHAGSTTFLTGLASAGGGSPKSVQLGPDAIILPYITGTASVGSELTARDGYWLRAKSYTFQWSRCVAGSTCQTVKGATSKTYEITGADEGVALVVTVTATNAVASASATSPRTAMVPDPPPPAPVNTAPPVITGSATVGATLGASAGSWSNSPTSYSYQWSDCNSSGTGCASISGAASSAYTVGAGDESSTLEVTVAATNAGGSTVASSSATALVPVPPPPAPVNTSLPVITGSATVGSTLATTQGLWTNSPTSYSYQWRDCNSSGAGCASISGATSSAYTVGAADESSTLEVTVTASNAGGSGAASSSATALVPVPPPPAPVNTSLPVITGSATVGSTLATTQGLWTNSPTSYSYQWRDCNSSGAGCASISGATSSAYTVGAADESSTLEVTVTASNAGGSGAASSSATALVPVPPPPAPVNTSLPVITGSATVGSTLATTQGLWTNSPTSYSYQWRDCNSSGAGCTNIAGATSAGYPVAAGDEGHALVVTVTATNAGGSGAASSNATTLVPVPPPPAPVNTSLPVITGSATVGSTLATTQGLWTNSPTSYSYQWRDCNSSGAGCTNIAGATSAGYPVAAGDEGHALVVTVTATNAGGSGAASSNATTLVPVPPPPAPVNTSLPVITGSATSWAAFCRRVWVRGRILRRRMVMCGRFATRAGLGVRRSRMRRRARIRLWGAMLGIRLMWLCRR